MKIDTSTIENFENLTAEEKLDAILNLDLTDPGEVEKKYKDLISKANKEAKQYKDRMKTAEEKLSAQLTDDEKADAEKQQKYQELEEENNRLKREATIAKKTAFYQSIGFSSDLAKDTAEAFADGDFETVERNQKTAHEEFEKNIRADVARSNPHPKNVGGANTLTKADIMKVKDAEERQRLIAENMELFT